MLFDLTKKPDKIASYKIQFEANNQLSFTKLTKVNITSTKYFQIILMLSLFFKVIKNVLANQCINLILLVILFKFCKSPKKLAIRLPHFYEILFEITLSMLCFEVVTYYVHRALHYRIFYELFHKIHHEWTSPIAITATYCHPIEFVFNIFLPVTSGNLIFGTHLISTAIWNTIFTFQTTLMHSGYEFPYLPSPRKHDLHHLR